MSAVTSKPVVLTPDEFERSPDTKGFELVRGQLVEKHVSVESSMIALNIAFLLKSEARRTGEAAVFSSELAYRCYSDDPNKFRKPDGEGQRCQEPISRR